MSRSSPSAESPSLPVVVADVACTGCGCVCDDLQLTIRDERVVSATGTCPLSHDWFLAQRPFREASCRIDGRSGTLDEALARAAEILESSRAPLIYGLARSSTPGQRAAVALADHLGATIDTTASRRHGPSIVALQQVGESTCTLGEARHRCDVVVFWGADPLTSHPRHGERYSIDPPGLQVPRGRADRKVWVIDVKPTRTAAIADRTLIVPSGRDLELLTYLRLLIKGIDPASTPEWLDGDAARQLASDLKGAKSSIVYFGLGLTRHRASHLTIETLLRLVTELNDHSRAYARRLRIPGDIAGADSVLCWQTGFPFSVNLALGYPRYSPGEYSAEELMLRGETDAVLLIGSESVSRLSSAATERMKRLPTIVLDPPSASPLSWATVMIATATYGVHEPGTAYRMDETPIRLRSFLPGGGPTDRSVLESLRTRLTRRLP